MNTYFALIISIFITVFFSSKTFALGDLTVTPTRVIFEDRDRAKVLNLVNRGEKTATYRIEFIEMAMDQYGGFTEIETPQEGQQFSSNMVRYSPRQVTIEPGESQTIRLIASKPSNLAVGEYRSHLLMYAVPDNSANAVDIESVQKLKDKEVAFQVSAIFRVAIPVIIRHGNEETLQAEYNITDVKLNASENSETQEPQLEFLLTRTGNRSIYADLDVTFTPENSNEQYLLGKIKEYVVYVPNQSRVTKVPLEIPDNMRLEKGTVNITFYKDKNGNKEILSQSSLTL
ncbi:hypothetical protein MAH1_18870 [Sessilibacter sp. MAH1]